MKKIYSPDSSDKRLFFAQKELEGKGFSFTKKEENADYILLGINPDKKHLSYKKPIFAGNANGVYDYTKNEVFAIKNAYLTAEAAIALAISRSEKSLVNAPVLIVGFGRIGKALKRLLEPFTRDITVCVRNEAAAGYAACEGASAIGFESLKSCEKYSFIFNTVPHPVFNEAELKSIDKDTLLIDLASFPGGVDKHFAKHFEINLIEARGLPGKYSPEAAGKIVAETIINIIKEEGL